MKRSLAGVGIGLALAAGTLFLAPAAHSAPIRANIGAIQAASLHANHAVLRAVARTQVTRHAGAQVSRGHANVGTAHPTRSIIRAPAARTHGALQGRGRYGTSTYAHFSAAHARAGSTYSRPGYTGNARYSAAGTSHHCPNMTTTSGK